MDVKVMIEVTGEHGAGEMVSLTLKNSYYYYGLGHSYSPTLTGVSPKAASSEAPLTLTGNNFGYWLQDYRIVYIGTVRAMGGF